MTSSQHERRQLPDNFDVLGSALNVAKTISTITNTADAQKQQLHNSKLAVLRLYKNTFTDSHLRTAVLEHLREYRGQRLTEVEKTEVVNGPGADGQRRRQEEEVGAGSDVDDSEHGEDARSARLVKRRQQKPERKMKAKLRRREDDDAMFWCSVAAGAESDDNGDAGNDTLVRRRTRPTPASDRPCGSFGNSNNSKKTPVLVKIQEDNHSSSNRVRRLDFLEASLSDGGDTTSGGAVSDPEPGPQIEEAASKQVDEDSDMSEDILMPSSKLFSAAVVARIASRNEEATSFSLSTPKPKSMHSILAQQLEEYTTIDTVPPTPMATGSLGQRNHLLSRRIFLPSAAATAASRVKAETQLEKGTEPEKKKKFDAVATQASEDVFEAGPVQPLEMGRLRRRRNTEIGGDGGGGGGGDGGSEISFVGGEDSNDDDDGGGGGSRHSLASGSTDEANANNAVFGAATLMGGGGGGGERGGADIVRQPLVPSAAEAQRLFGPARQSNSTASANAGAVFPFAGSAAFTFSLPALHRRDNHHRAEQQQQQQQPTAPEVAPVKESVETPLQTLRRLLFETKELVNDLLDTGATSASTPPQPPQQQPSSPPTRRLTAQSATSISASTTATSTSTPTPATTLHETAARVDRQLAFLMANSAAAADDATLPQSQLAKHELLAALLANLRNAKLNAQPTSANSVPSPRSYPSYASAVVRSPPLVNNNINIASNNNPFAQPHLGGQIAASVFSSAQLASLSTPADSQSLQYDIYYQTTPNGPGVGIDTVFSDDFFEIERRVAVLERVVGSSAASSALLSFESSANASSLSSSSSSTQQQHQQSLLDEIAELDSTLTLLTTPHALARLSRRVQTITGQIERTVNLRRRIISDQQKLLKRRARLDSRTIFDSDTDDESDEETLEEKRNPAPRGEAAVNELVEHEMEQRRAEDERRVGYLFSTLTDRLDPMASTIPLLAQRLKGLKLLNAEISGTAVRETLTQVETEQDGLISEKFEKVNHAMAKIRVSIRQGAKIGYKRFEGIERGVHELVNVIDERFGVIPPDDEGLPPPAPLPITAMLQDSPARNFFSSVSLVKDPSSTSGKIIPDAPQLLDPEEDTGLILSAGPTNAIVTAAANIPIATTTIKTATINTTTIPATSASPVQQIESPTDLNDHELVAEPEAEGGSAHGTDLGIQSDSSRGVHESDSGFEVIDNWDS
ncbi:hypothetical protein HK100_002329 [Physocladia obscura]|uniref:Uncharacterized protein n=1 Tax=Physocladia obscura TaxID=109957 RepID=A0AAD5XJI7_9FUNG|nr:hypothetical protein HK100_002329 [Physocladia obscura]